MKKLYHTQANDRMKAFFLYYVMTTYDLQHAGRSILIIYFGIWVCAFVYTHKGMDAGCNDNVCSVRVRIHV